MKDKIGIIYGLIDPRYDIIRYVGQTVTTLKERFQGHMDEAKKIDTSRDTYYKLNWIRKLLSLGLEPKPVLLAYNISVPFITYLQNDFANEKNKFRAFYDFDSLDKEEKLFISISREECSSFGIECVNSKISIGHGWGHRFAWNKGLTKEKDSRLILSSETRQNQSEAQNRPDVKANNRNKHLGKFHTEEYKQLMSKINSGNGNAMFGKNVKEFMTLEAYNEMVRKRSESKRRNFLLSTINTWT